MRMIYSLMSAAMALSAMNFGPIVSPAKTKTRRFWKTTYTSSCNPNINRWTGRPHEHKREIARRLRQQG